MVNTPDIAAHACAMFDAALTRTQAMVSIKIAPLAFANVEETGSAPATIAVEKSTGREI